MASVAVLGCCTGAEDASQYLGSVTARAPVGPGRIVSRTDGSAGSQMVYNDVIEKIGMTIDAVGVVASAVRLSRRESDVCRRFRGLTSVAILAAIVFIRTFLSFSLEVETTGRSPWQKGEVTAS
jgi:Protein of unknown function (DUF1622)